jgi:membrane-associated phospholipid phosphatase
MIPAVDRRSTDAARASVRWRVKVVIGTAFLASCGPSDAKISVLSVAPYTPIATEASAPLELEAPVVVGSPESAKEIDELIAQQSTRNEPAIAEALSWQASPVMRWNEIARGLVAKYNTAPPAASRVYALLSIAQHDALVAAIRAHQRYQRRPPSDVDPRIRPLFSASVEATYPSDHASIAAASAEILSKLFPHRADVIVLNAKAEAHKESRILAGVSYRSDVLAGDRIGRRVAEAVFEYAKSDGSKRTIPWPGTVPTGKGMWFSSETPSVEPVRPYWGSVRPWLMTSGSQFRSKPPPGIDSPEFNRALEELRDIARQRTPEQMKSALFWADGPGTPTPPGHWNEIAGNLLLSHPTSLATTARVMALLNMALMDAGISCWDTKYTYWLLRPSQADPTITLPIGLPNFPSYTSGHSTFSGAAAEVLEYFFPDEREKLQEMAKDASMSRMYGGIHYRFDGEEGLAAGRAIGRLAIEKERAERRE